MNAKPIQYLSVVALTPYKPNLITDISRLVANNECNILSSRMVQMQSDMSTAILIAGPWNAIAKIENGLTTLEKKHKIQITHQRTDAAQMDTSLLPYMAQMVGLDQPGVLYEMAQFFKNNKIPILDLQVNVNQSNHTQTNIFSMTIHVGIPTNVGISELRDQLMELCDELNVDGILEPERR